ncbi:MAG: hypothetical protein JRM80_13855, partial [Nitrososphaerota archaeon]|nr:hypothetical protein [Nitrososphaerota archaeon]
MESWRHDIRKMALAVVVIAIIAVAGAYYLSSGGGGGSTQDTTRSSGSKSTVSVPHTTSSQQTTTTTQRTDTTTSNATCSGTGSQSYQQQIQTEMVPMLKALSAMSLVYNGSASGTQFSYSAQYQVLAANTTGPLTTYEVRIVEVAGTSSQTATAWANSDGSVNLLEMSSGGS